MLSSLRYQPVVPGEPLDEKQSVLLKWDLGDKTPIQIDMSSLNPDSTAMDVMTCYRYFTMLEKQKKATQYELSYSEVTRQVDASGDSFKIQLKSPRMYRTMPESWPSFSLSPCSRYVGSCLGVDGSHCDQTAAITSQWLNMCTSGSFQAVDLQVDLLQCGKAD